MSEFDSKSHNLFIPAISLSIVLHGLVIAASGLRPGTADLSVLQGPNSLDMTVVYQPVVTVLEKEIVTEEVSDEQWSDEPVHVSSRAVAVEDKVRTQAVSSRKSLGAINKAKPLNDVNPAPEYPRLARQRGWEGTVRLKVTVEKDGTPSQVDVHQSSGHDVLDRSALTTVKNWKFVPARAGTMRFSSKIIIPFRFELVQEN